MIRFMTARRLPDARLHDGGGAKAWVKYITPGNLENCLL